MTELRQAKIRPECFLLKGDWYRCVRQDALYNIKTNEIINGQEMCCRFDKAMDRVRSELNKL